MLSIKLLLGALLLCGPVNAQLASKPNENSKNMEVNMSVIESNKETVRKLYEQALNKRNLELLNEIISDEYVGVGGLKGADGFTAPVNAIINAFPDAHWKIKELVEEGNNVVVRWTVTGTHSYPFQGIKATGKVVSSDGIGIYKFKEGKVISVHVLTDRLGFLQELEILPYDLSALQNNNEQKDNIRFIDKFIVPENARQEFIERMNVNRNFIRKLPGFMEDAVYERIDEHGNRIYVTIAAWENEEVLKKAKEAVQAEYKRQGFDLPKMLERLNISMERGMYKVPD